MKIYIIKAFSGVFHYCWEKIIFYYLFLFASKTHKKFPSQEDKIGWFPSQLQSEQPASRTTTILYNVLHNGRGKRPLIPSVGGGGGAYLSKVSQPSYAWNARKHHQFKDKPFRTNKVPSQLIGTPTILPAAARFLWGTDKVRNRFVVCPCHVSRSGRYFFPWNSGMMEKWWKTTVSPTSYPPPPPLKVGELLPAGLWLRRSSFYFRLINSNLK